MDIAKLLVYRHAPRMGALFGLAAIACSAAILLVLVVQLLVAANGGPTPEVPRLAPFRWHDPDAAAVA